MLAPVACLGAAVGSGLGRSSSCPVLYGSAQAESDRTDNRE